MVRYYSQLAIMIVAYMLSLISIVLLIGETSDSKWVRGLSRIKVILITLVIDLTLLPIKKALKENGTSIPVAGKNNQ